MDYYNPTKQTLFDTNGNCLSAVIATLFDINISDIPIFADDGEYWSDELSKWMFQNFGKYVVPIKLSEIDDVHIFCESLVITTINSPNPKVLRHAVITKGNRIVFDPMVGEVDLHLTNDMNPTFLVIGDVRKLANHSPHSHKSTTS